MKTDKPSKNKRNISQNLSELELNETLPISPLIKPSSRFSKKALILEKWRQPKNPL